jgi:hypothetical protein
VPKYLVISLVPKIAKLNQESQTNNDQSFSKSIKEV